MPLYSVIDTTSSKRCYLLQSASMLATAFTALVSTAKSNFTITLMIGSLFITDNFDPNNCCGFSLTKIVPPTATDAATTAAAAAAAASQAAAAAAAAATIAATLPAIFDTRNLPTDVRARYDIFHHPTDILKNTTEQPQS